MRVGGIGARATGEWCGRRIASVAACFTGAVLSSWPAWSQNTGGTQIFDAASGQLVTFPNVIADGNTPTTVVKIDAGTLLLTGLNTYTGSTAIIGGTLGIGAGGSIAPSSGVNLVASGTIFDISSGGNQTIRDLTGVSGSAVTLGANTLTAGTADSPDFAGTISGTGGLTKQGTGTLTLGGINFYTGATAINAGTLAIGVGGSVAASSGINLLASGTTFDISNGGNQTIRDLSGVAGSAVTLGANTLTVGTGNSTAFAGVISGTGGLIKQGAGILTLTGANTYSGGTTVIAGTLLGNATSLQGVITDNAVVEFNQAAAGSYTGTITGFGNLVITGSGGLTMTGNSSGFAGNPIINGGGLTLGPTATSGGSLGGSVVVENGGFVTGHGTIAGSLASPSGYVASTGAVVPLTVGGNYTQGSAGTLLVGLSPTAATRLAVNGSATLSGTLNIVAASGQNYVPFSQFTILDTGGIVSGAFGSEVSTPLVLPLTVEYLPQAVDLVLGGFTGATGNEAAVAAALNKAFPNATGDFATVLDLAVKLPPSEMQQSLSSFGGQIYGNLAQISLQDRRLFLGALDERLRLLGGGSPSAAVLGSLGGSVPGAWGSGANAVQLAALSDAINDPVGIADAPYMTSTSASPPAPDPEATPYSVPTPDSAAGNAGNVWARGFWPIWQNR